MRSAKQGTSGMNPFQIKADPLYQGVPGGAMSINDLVHSQAPEALSA